MDWLTETRWSPYLVGIGIGILSWFTFLISKKPIGCSTAFARTSGMLQKLFRGKKIEQNIYYQEVPPVVDWEWMLVLGIAVFFVLIGVKMVPTYLENYSIKQVLANMENDRTVRKMSPNQMRESFFKRLKINGVYEFEKDDLKVESTKGGIEVKVDYEVRKPILGNVSVLMEFSESATIKK